MNKAIENDFDKKKKNKKRRRKFLENMIDDIAQQEVWKSRCNASILYVVSIYSSYFFVFILFYKDIRVLFIINSLVIQFIQLYHMVFLM